MTILHINLQKTWRGGERQLSWLMEELSKKEVNQLLICRKNSKLEQFAKNNNLPHFSFSVNIYNLIFIAFKISKIITNPQKTIIHCHDSKSHTIAFLSKLIFKSSIKIIVHRKVLFPIKGFFSKKIKYSQKYINSIICISKAIQKNIISSTGHENTIVIPDMIKEINFSKNNILKNRFKIKNPIKIGYIAALTLEKDHITFLNTAKIILEKDKSIDFVIIGEGELKEKLIAYTNLLGINENVYFIGFIENIYEIIPEIDLLLFTSVSEGLGSTILDFFMAKIPVVTVQNGGSEELVFDGETGLICEPKNSAKLAYNCISILSNQKLKQKIIHNAYIYAEKNFNPKIISERVYNEYLKII